MRFYNRRVTISAITNTLIETYSGEKVKNSTSMNVYYGCRYSEASPVDNFKSVSNDDVATILIRPGYME